MDELLTELREAVERLEWTFAKTMPTMPHWYIVRRPGIEQLYVRLFNAILEHGEDRRHGRFKNRYLELGDGFKYWAMTRSLPISRIINRDRLEAVEKEGGHEAG